MKPREKKKHEKKQRLEQSRLQKKERLERVLAALGLLKGFRELPGTYREAAIRRLPGRPRVVISPTAQRSPAMADLKDGIERALAEVTMCTEDGKSFPLLDFLSVCPTLRSGFSSLTSAPLSQKQRLFVEHAAKVSAAFFKERIGDTLEELDTEIMVYLLVDSRIDCQVFGCLLEDQGFFPGKPVFQLTLLGSEPREIRVEIDGQGRPAFQCAVPWGFDGIQWMECGGAALGLDSGRQYPVFLQSHALRRLRERLKSRLVPEVTLQIGLMCSLAELTVVERRGDRWLIAFHLRGIRVGYLVARVFQDKVVITTFLLLTMEGTPECRLLKRNLGLTRRDIEYEGLDRLETFLAPDVLADKDLVRVLEESGCGSLLALARDGFSQTAVAGRAEELKRFLRITGGANRKLSRGLCSPGPPTA
jgi:hypothetical protein